VPAVQESAQRLLPLGGTASEAHDAVPAASRTSRALHAVVRATTSVAVAAPSVTPHGPSPYGVVLTETERVRLRIMQAQIKLSSLVLYEGPIDGVLNLDTVAGLRHFQTLKGLRESGQVTAATLRALGVPVE
jgi:peptidoglycan hydrolase-like protein with peptidoglycan-binding domain